LQSGLDAYQKIITIWMSKIALVTQRALVENPFGTEDFAWIDASVSRFNGRRAGWNFAKAAQPDGQLLHYANCMRYQGDVLPINASCMIADRGTWTCVNEAFAAKLAEHADDDYAHDEETILGFVHRDNPDLFRCLGQNYTGRRESWGGKPHSLVRRYDAWQVSRAGAG
jgi:hypothetical protein